jgi:hypothetical protein
MGWVVNTMPQLLYPWERDPVPLVREAGWARGPVWRVRKISPPTKFNSRIFQPIISRYTDQSGPLTALVAKMQSFIMSKCARLYYFRGKKTREKQSSLLLSGMPVKKSMKIWQLRSLTKIFIDNNLFIHYYTHTYYSPSKTLLNKYFSKYAPCVTSLKIVGTTISNEPYVTLSAFFLLLFYGPVLDDEYQPVIPIREQIK